MAALALRPNQPDGYPDIVSYGYGGGMGPSASQSSVGADYVTPEQYAAAIQQAQALLNAKAGGATPFERQVQQQKIEDLKRGYKNSLKIAQLQAETSRYGVDEQRKTAIEQLKQADRQFAARHDLDVRQADISEAQLISSQRSEPNRLFQTMDLEQALGTIRNGGRATTMPLQTGVAAFDRLSTDYGGNRYLASSGGSQAASVGNGAGGGTDQRIKAARAVMDALPPSSTEGLDPTGVAALNAVYSLYRAPLRPGTMESLSPTQRAGLQSGAQRVQKYTGRSYDDLMSEYRKSLPWQQSVRAAA